jgi:hypothetical protein
MGMLGSIPTLDVEDDQGDWGGDLMDVNADADDWGE